MEAFKIEGGHPLVGELEITGAKNAILGILAGTLLCKDKFRIENVPHIGDVDKYLDILRKKGVKINFTDDVLEVDTTGVNSFDCRDLVTECGHMRASYYLLGAFLGRYKEAKVPMPGGCKLGDRPMDQHFKGFRKLGSDINVSNGNILLKADDLKGTDISFDVISVGATINTMLAAVLAEGKTTLTNVAKEPHVVDIANFLNQMGANIKGAGTDTITINGVKDLHGCEYSVIPDQITTGTYMIAAAATEGDVVLRNTIPKHMEDLTRKLRDMGVQVDIVDDTIHVKGKKPFKPLDVKTMPYPGFPTDLQPPLVALLTIADGQSSIDERIFNNRFEFISELVRMGADAVVHQSICLINGIPQLLSTQVSAPDLRAGAALVIAALTADGESIVKDIQYIDRGYEDMEGNLSRLGANIERINLD